MLLDKRRGKAISGDGDIRHGQTPKSSFGSKGLTNRELAKPFLACQTPTNGASIHRYALFPKHFWPRDRKRVMAQSVRQQVCAERFAIRAVSMLSAA
jgi:hypothetical protein